MEKRISKRRQEMGEDAWAIYQKEKRYGKYKKYAENNPERIKQLKDNVTKCRQKRKIDLIAYKGGKCERCKLESNIPDIYDFHHLDPTQKEFGLGSKAGKSKSLEEMKKEVDKCQLLCRNCHAIIHYLLRQK